MRHNHPVSETAESVSRDSPGSGRLDHKQPGQGRLGRVLTVKAFHRQRVKAKQSCVVYSSGAKRHKGQLCTRRSRDDAGCSIETSKGGVPGGAVGCR